MTHLRVAILEDEPLARRRLARLLSEAGCEVLGAFEDGAKLLEWLGAGPAVDALFMDIQLPGLNGFEVLAEMSEAPAVVFVTACTDQAIQAFSVRAVDYLVKPVYEDRLGDTLGRLARLKSSQPGVPASPCPTPSSPVMDEGRAVASLPLHPSRASHGVSGPGSDATPVPTRIVVKAGDGKLFLELRRITHFSIEREMAWAWSGGKRFKTLWTCAREIEMALPGVELARIQRNILLRPESVIGFRPLLGGRMSLRLPDNQELEVSRSATPEMRKRLGGDF